jgi:hypothetical protein
VLHNYQALSGPRQLLFWIVIVSMPIIAASIFEIAHTWRQPSVANCLAFRVAWAAVFLQIAFRLASGAKPGHIGYGSVVVYAAPGLACLWAILDALRERKGPT